MKTVTFDWNCIISVEKSDVYSSDVLQLVEFHRSGIVDVGITTVSASESLKGSQHFPASAAQFSGRIENLGWQDLTTLLGPAVIGLTYFDMCKFVDENFENERDQIWQVLGGKTPRSLPLGLAEDRLHSPEYKRWRNVWCDVHTLWTHIKCGRDVFVTTNSKDFQNKFDQLHRLGLRDVKTPSDMVQELLSG